MMVFGINCEGKTMSRASERLCRDAGVALLALASALPASAASTCFGTTGHGRLECGVQLPARGVNFSAYSPLGAQLGRNWVHASVANLLVAVYGQLATTAPGVRYVYGETGRAHGGPMPPHRTHEAGISVDFMVPVRDAAGRSVPLPSSLSNKFGYALEFDVAGKAGAYTIDFDALGEHLYQLAAAGQRAKVPVERVIFDPRLMAHLFKTRHGAALRALPFMRQKPWIRHDEHYHVDFAIACRPY
jgi:penicillin-insensitive murein endopeptidase